MSADTLSVKARDFYERARFKQLLALILAAAGIASLGFCAEAGGESSAYTTRGDSGGLDDVTENQYDALSSGYGFATFFFLLACAFFLGAAIYIGPVCCGSANEKLVLKSPQEPEAKSAV
jgi:hypothetical protein